MKVSWSHCVLKVRDLDAMVKFYCDTMGWVVSDRGPMGPPSAPEIVFMTGSSSDHHQMALVGIRGASEETSLDHNAFRVESVADVKAIHEKLVGAGALELSPKAIETFKSIKSAWDETAASL